MVDHLTSVPPPSRSSRSKENELNEDLVEQFGNGTEENPLKIFRNVSMRNSSIDFDERRIKRLICLSDTHNKIDRIRIPDGDILIHCGDAVNHWTSSRDLRRFNRFIGNLSHQYKLFVSGNHCVSLDPSRPDLSQKILSNLIYLQDESIDIEGLHIYGSPWRPKRGCFYRSEAFGYDSKRIGQDKWSLIPSSIDILLTHSPPFGIRDYCLTHGNRLGCYQLFEHIVQRVRPRLHLFGHVHDSHGISLFKSQSNQSIFSSQQANANFQEDFQIFFVNLSIKQRRHLGQPIVIDFIY